MTPISHCCRGTAGLTIVLFLVLHASAQVPVTLEPVASGFNEPLYVAQPPGEMDRLFVVEKETGLVRIVEDGEIFEEPFLDVGGVIATGGEEGLLGLAFDPNYATNGRVYVSLVRNRGLFQDNDSQLLRYTVSSDPNQVNPHSRTLLLEVPQPFLNHNGGMITFGPDGYLYYALGDGGSGGDPLGNGQDMSTPYGAILRLDVNGDTAVAAPGNPFASVEGADERIWAYGLRNPWRFSFDRMTGDLWIADVGQGDFEEVNFRRADVAGGGNYGWNILEGDACFADDDCEAPADYVGPIHTYGFPGSQSVTGGYVYRGGRMPFLQGTYFFADFVTADIWSLRYDGQTVSEFTDRGAALEPDVSPVAISSFGEDNRGELYLTSFNGTVYKLVPDTPDEDIDADGNINAVDIQLVINGALAIDTGGAVVDVDGDGDIDAVDVQSTINAALGITS